MQLLSVYTVGLFIATTWISSSTIHASNYVSTFDAYWPPRCRYGVLPRKEWRALTVAERQLFISTLRQVMQRPTPTTPSFYDLLVRMHYEWNPSTHGYPIFLPYHRWFVRLLEAKMQEFARVTIPYWDWGLDSQAPELSIIWADEAFGGNGAGAWSCVPNGRFRDYVPMYPWLHCVWRRFAQGSRMGALVSTSVLNRIIASSMTYDTFRTALELQPHNGVHTAIGGDMATMYSPSDPIFYLHHTNVDRLYTLWQAAHPNVQWQHNGIRVDGRQASGWDRLGPLRPMVWEVLNPGYLCYYYQSYDPRQPPPPPPPPPSPPPTTRTTATATVTAAITSTPTTTSVAMVNAMESVGVSLQRRAAPPPPIGSFDLVTTPDNAFLPPSSDRSHLTFLRAPDPIPEWMIKMNHVSVETFRAHEAQLRAWTEEANKAPGVSPAALWNRPDFVEQIAQNVSITNFIVDIPGDGNRTRIIVQNPVAAASMGTNNPANPFQGSSNPNGKGAAPGVVVVVDVLAKIKTEVSQGLVSKGKSTLNVKLSEIPLSNITDGVIKAQSVANPSPSSKAAEVLSLLSPQDLPDTFPSGGRNWTP